MSRSNFLSTTVPGSFRIELPTPTCSDRALTSWRLFRSACRIKPTSEMSGKRTEVELLSDLNPLDPLSPKIAGVGQLTPFRRPARFFGRRHQGNPPPRK